MGDAQTLLDLAVRVEAASGLDRELDCLIWCATAESHFEYHGGDIVLAVQGGFSARLVWKDLPHPTASLDAAMTLRPTGWTIANIGEGDDGSWWAELREGYLTSYDRVAMSALKCASPALALTAAALRARTQVPA